MRASSPKGGQTRGNWAAHSAIGTLDGGIRELVGVGSAEGAAGLSPLEEAREWKFHAQAQTCGAVSGVYHDGS